MERPTARGRRNLLCFVEAAVRILAHAHTTYSEDGELTPQQLATLARGRGFQAVLLSDHFEHLTKERFDALVAECRSISECLMIPGYERSWGGYHVLALGVDQWFDDAGLPGWAAKVRGAGAITAMAHPGRYAYEIPEDVLAACDAVEVWNSKRGYDGGVGPNPRAYDLLGAGRRPLCGQDLHGVRHASSVALELDATRVDRACILDTIHQGRYRMANRLYGFDGTLPASARAVLTVVHAGRRPAINAAITIVKKLKRARRYPRT
jgi:hypothetical protein